jgi:hypothetical protein
MDEPRSESPLRQFLTVIVWIIVVVVVGWRLLVWAHVIADGAPQVGRAIWDATDPSP